MRLTVPRRGGWRAWGAVRADFEHALADPADSAIASAEIASELRRGADYVRVILALTVLSTDVADALTIAWGAFRSAARDDLAGWEVTAATAEVQPEPPLTSASGYGQRRSRPVVCGQAPADRGSRHAARLAWHSRRLQRTTAAAASALRSDEPQYIGGPDLIRGPGHHREAPANLAKDIALAEALLARSDADDEFRQALESWWQQAQPIRASIGKVVNTISGGTQQGPVLQGRDFSNITFSAAPATPPVPPTYSQGAP